MPKYALPEIERRMRVRPEDVPDLHDLPFDLIADRYFDFGRMRLRKITPGSGGPATFKLCKKYGATHAYTEPIVNIYLEEAEYAALRQLPGNDLLKRSYRLEWKGRRFRLDAHTGALAGLYLCETEAGSVEELLRGEFPPFAREDVTQDERFSGAFLAKNQGATPAPLP